VEQDVQAAMARIQLSHRGVLAASQAGHEGAGVLKGAASAVVGADPPRVAKSARNEHRQARSQRGEAHQATFLELVADGAEPPTSVTPGEAEAPTATGEEDL
jgi:hypothetical protein